MSISDMQYQVICCALETAARQAQQRAAQYAAVGAHLDDIRNTAFSRRGNHATRKISSAQIAAALAALMDTHPDPAIRQAHTTLLHALVPGIAATNGSTTEKSLPEPITEA